MFDMFPSQLLQDHLAIIYIHMHSQKEPQDETHKQEVKRKLGVSCKTMTKTKLCAIRKLAGRRFSNVSYKSSGKLNMMPKTKTHIRPSQRWSPKTTQTKTKKRRQVGVSCCVVPRGRQLPLALCQKHVSKMPFLS